MSHMWAYDSWKLLPLLEWIMQGEWLSYLEPSMKGSLGNRPTMFIGELSHFQSRRKAQRKGEA